MNITKLLNGTNAHQPERGWKLLSASTIRPSVNPRRSVVEIPRSHGSRPTGRPPVFGEPTVRMEWVLQATTQSDLEGSWHDLVSLLSRPGLTYGHHVDDVVTEAPAELVSISEPGDFAAARVMTMSAILALPGVFLRDQSYTTSPTLADGTHDLTTWGGTAPISDAVVRFNGGALDVSVTDSAYGEGISWNGSAPIGSGTYLYLDPAQWRAWSSTSGSQWTPGGTDRTRWLDRPAAGRLQLWPRTTVTPGAETVVATNLVPNANMTAASDGQTVGTASSAMVDEANVVEGGRTLSRWTAVGTGNFGINVVPSGAIPESTEVHYRIRARASRTLQVRARVNGELASSQTPLPAGQWVDVVGSLTTGSGSSLNTGFLLSGATSGHEVGDVIDVDHVYIGTVASAYFDGGTPNSGSHVYRWTGDPHDSTSQKVHVGPPGPVTRARTVTVSGGTCIIRARGAHL